MHDELNQLTTSNKDKIPFFAVEPRVTVHLGARGTRLALPVVEGASLVRDDVPLGYVPVQPPTS